MPEQAAIPAGMTLRSGLWLDQPDAAERVDSMVRQKRIGGDDASRFRQFIERGYFTFPIELHSESARAVQQDVDRFWSERPENLAYAYDGPARSMSQADEARERKPGSRIHDIHSHSAVALSLYLHREIFGKVELLLAEKPVAFQSLYFQFGSQQMIHRDPIVVPTSSPGHLLAAWIALEDIDPESGALIIVPGSHKLPYFEFTPGQYMYDGKVSGDKLQEAVDYYSRQRASHGLEEKLHTPRRGEVLIWHASLFHGGSRITRPGLTRRSYVVHYSTRRTYESRAITIEDSTGPVVMRTSRILERDGCEGFDNPMRDYRRPG